MSDDLCDMKIKDLRNLAKKKDINVRDSKGKLKNKCKLMIEIIKKKYMSDNEIDFGDVEIEEPDEIDFGDVQIERSQPTTKVTRFGDVSEKIIEVQNKPGKKVKGKSYTRRLLSEKETKNFIPSKMSNKKFKQIETEKQQSELSSMATEDIIIPSNDYPKYRIAKLNNPSTKKIGLFAKLSSESSKSPFKIFKIKKYIDDKNFILQSKNPLSTFDPQTKEFSKQLDKSTIDEVFTIPMNDSKKFSVLRISNDIYARKINDYGPVFELYELLEYENPSNFLVKNSKKPTAKFDTRTKNLTFM